MVRKPSKGKQKIEIKRIENEEALQVTFSKRRSGLFKKASELTTLCGADVLIMVFSPAGRPYSFGQPEVDAVMNRFLSYGSPPALPDPVQRHRESVVHQLNQQYAELRNCIEVTKGNRAILEEKVKIARGNQKSSWESGFELLNLEELEHLSKGLAELKMRADARITEIMTGGGASSSRAPLVVNPISMVNPFAIGGANYQQIYGGAMEIIPKFN